MSDRRVPDLPELAERISKIDDRLGRMEEKLDDRYVGREVYEARHMALRSEVALEVARLDRDARTAKQLAMWSVGMIAALVIGTVVTWLAQGGGA